MQFIKTLLKHVKSLANEIDENERYKNVFGLECLCARASSGGSSFAEDFDRL